MLALHMCRGELLMAHCHPLLMVQTVYQPPDEHIASQKHAPEAIVLLANVQQRPNSQHHAKGSAQSLVALVVTQENVFVGGNMAHQVSHKLQELLPMCNQPISL